MTDDALAMPTPGIPPARDIPPTTTPTPGIPLADDASAQPPPPGDDRGAAPRTTVLVVDDHPLVRGGLISLLSSTPDLAVVGEAGGGLDAVRMAAELAPDVTLMDLSMPDIGGAEATRRILAARPDAHIVVLTSFHDQVRVREALEAGAIGFLLKDAEPAVLLSAVRAAARGDAPLDPRVARALLPRAASPVPTAGPGPGPGPTPGPGPALSTREAEVLRLLTRGMSNKQIGTHLGIAERTVKAHVGSIFRHLGVADRTSAALWARDNRF